MLDFHICDTPTCPHPLNVTNRGEIISRKIVGYNTNGIAKRQHGINFFTFTNASTRTSNIAVVETLCDLLLIHTRCSFNGLRIPDHSVKFRHRVSGD